MSTHSPNDAYQTTFNPSTYLRTYYAGDHVTDDERINLLALITLMQKDKDHDEYKRQLSGTLPPSGVSENLLRDSTHSRGRKSEFVSHDPGIEAGRGGHYRQVLEVGCGPTIHHAAPLAPYVDELHLSDYLPANLAEVQKWLDQKPDAHDWSVYLGGLLELEGVRPTPDAVEARAGELRKKIKKLLVCDLLRDDPLSQPAMYDLVTCFYTAECAARSKDEWRQVMHRLASLVKPGGTLFQVSMRNCEHYAVGDRTIPATPVNENDLLEILPNCGFDMSRTTVTPVSVNEWADHGFAGVCVVTARKG